MLRCEVGAHSLRASSYARGGHGKAREGHRTWVWAWAWGLSLFCALGLRLVCFRIVGDLLGAPSQCDVDGRSSNQGTSTETRYFSLNLNLK